jgi:hypothetical protein
MWTLVPVRAFGGDLELCAGLTWYGMDVKALDSSPGGRKPRQEFAHRVACVYYEPVVVETCGRRAEDGSAVPRNLGIWRVQRGHDREPVREAVQCRVVDCALWVSQALQMPAKIDGRLTNS